MQIVLENKGSLRPNLISMVAWTNQVACIGMRGGLTLLCDKRSDTDDDTSGRVMMCVIALRRKRSHLINVEKYCFLRSMDTINYTS